MSFSVDMGKFISFPPSDEQSPRYPSSVTDGGGTTEDGGWKEIAEDVADAEEVDGKAADGEGDERAGGSGVPGAEDAGVLITPFDVLGRAFAVAGWVDSPEGPA